MFDNAELGGRVPVRPGTGGGDGPLRCLRGHLLRVGGVTRSYHLAYGAPMLRCLVCTATPGETRAAWCLIDPARQVTKPSAGFSLVATPPAVRGGVGRIAVHLDRRAVADIDIAVCGPCRVSVVEQLRVDPEFRRMGLGRLLASAALARAPADRYRWSTTAIDDTLEARSFWATVDFPGELGDARYCRDMLWAAGHTVDF